jgi:adenylosuccinate synthase
MRGKVDVLLGLQFGDEGKGKIVDLLTPKYDIVARFQGGANAGHSLHFDGKSYVLHLIPSGIFRENCINVIGNGVVIDPISLVDEIQNLESEGVDVKSRLIISDKAHLVLPSHKLADKLNEDKKGESKIGSTLKGIGPTYTDKVSRNGVRVSDIFTDFLVKTLDLTSNHIKDTEKINNFENVGNVYQDNKLFLDACEKLKEYTILDTTYYLNQALSEGKSILAEGAQGTLLDNDFGTYPFVTSSNTTIGGVLTGLGVPANSISKVIGIAKAYTTRVGSGPFPTELTGPTGDDLRKIGAEWGATTGRPRRCGWLDLPILKYSCMINGVTELYLMKVDVLNTFKKIKVCTEYVVNGNLTNQLPNNLEEVFLPNYEDFDGWMVDISSNRHYESLPVKLKKYVEFIEKYLGIPIKLISNGPVRDEFITK